MGGLCSGSQRHDVIASPRRVRSPAPPKPPGTLAAVPIKIKSIGGDEEKAYSGSYTSQKTKEYTILHQIVTKTRGDFIDVLHEPQHIDQAEAASRGNMYVRKLSRVQITDVLSPLFELPNSAHNNLQVIASVLSARTDSGDLSFARECSAKVATAVKSLNVSAPGPVVQTFDEL